MKVQDLISQDLFDNANNISSEMVQNLLFLRDNGTHLTNKQIRALILLQSEGMIDIANSILMYKQMTVPRKAYFKMIDKITLGERIKGTAKLKDLLKHQSTNNDDYIKREELQPQALKESELK